MDGAARTRPSPFRLIERRWRVPARRDGEPRACRTVFNNLGNAGYWAFHPYPQRTFSLEVRYDH